MNYQMVPLDVIGNLKIYGVRFNGGNFMFWHKINISVIKKVVVVFEEKYQNMELSDDMILLSLNGINDYQKWINIINIFIEIMKNDKSKINFQFVVGSDEQARVVERLGKEIGILFEINNVNAVQEENKVNEEAMSATNVEQIFYLDNNGNISNSDGNSLGKRKALTYKKPNVGLSLMPKEGHVAPPLNRAAFISFPVIIFILSALMLIGSMILLFILD